VLGGAVWQFDPHEWDSSAGSVVEIRTTDGVERVLWNRRIGT
jgi:hypothetical protein